MAVLESRQVVVWSIPTIAALVLGLVWLRRRRQRDPGGARPPSPPPNLKEVPSSTPSPLVRSSPILIPLSPISHDSVDQPPFPGGEDKSTDYYTREAPLQVEEEDSEEEAALEEEPEQKEEAPVAQLEVQAYDGNATVELFSRADTTSSSQIPDSGVGTLSGVVPSESATCTDTELAASDREEEVVFDTLTEEPTLTSAEHPDSEVPPPNQVESLDVEEGPGSRVDFMPGSLPENTSGVVNECPVEGSAQLLLENGEETLIAEPERELPPLDEKAPPKEEPEPGDVPETVVEGTHEERPSADLKVERVDPIDMEKGVLEQKLASLELDTMKISQEGNNKENAERDSANQSPSEVMLASPSISNFSDANSEGSSDSGKGHSDVATSPSRTPAGGSSLAGDSAFSVYEFILPQVMVGRLIGRHGSFIHEIRIQTHTNIFIKRHPDTSKLKICAIEGTQQDIDKAIEKIRQKFPLRRFPKLTLEKVSFVSINNPPPLKAEDFHLQLVEGVNNDVILSSLISAAHFFLQQPSHPTYTALSRLNQVMNVVYSNAEAPVLDSPVKDAICAAPTMGGWYRAQIVSVDEDNLNCDVRFLDYGGYLNLETSVLRQIRGDLLMLPFQAVECYLANVSPVGEEDWSEEARLVVQSMTHGQLLQAQIYDYAENGVPQVYLYSTVGDQIVLINEELVARGLATIVTPPAEE